VLADRLGGKGKHNIFVPETGLTQIGLKLFDKMLFVRNDTGSLSESGCVVRSIARIGSILSVEVYLRAYFR